MFEDSIIGEKEKGKLVIISGPSGSGKTSICNLLTKNPKIKQSVSYTTRKQRDGERDGIEYCFIEKSEFEKLVDENRFIEYAEYCGYLYGTSVSTIKEAIENKEILILAIDVKGALQVIDKMPEAISIFIMAPDDKTLKLRLKNRLADNDTVIDKRFIVSKEEMGNSKYYDYCVINDRLDDAVKEIEGILNLS